VSAFTVRLATGTEYWYSEHRPAVGESIAHLGRTYVVTRVADEGGELLVVTVEEVARREAERDVARRLRPRRLQAESGIAPERERTLE
jgi:hypothetical protein